MPPPEPKSSTTSPGFKRARAVGFPQPSDASTASTGSPAFCCSSYRFAVIGSTAPAGAASDPQQQEAPPEITRSACPPYLSLTTSLISICVVLQASGLHSFMIDSGFTALLRVQHSA